MSLRLMTPEVYAEALAWLAGPERKVGDLHRITNKSTVITDEFVLVSVDLAIDLRPPHGADHRRWRRHRIRQAARARKARRGWR